LNSNWVGAASGEGCPAPVNFIKPGLVKARQGNSRPTKYSVRTQCNNSDIELIPDMAMRSAEVCKWHIASLRGDAAVQSLSEQSGHLAPHLQYRIYEYVA